MSQSFLRSKLIHSAEGPKMIQIRKNCEVELDFRFNVHRLECAILCRSEVRCQSYNYCEDRLCELNNVTISDVTADHVTNNSQCEYRGTPNDCEKVDPSLEVQKLKVADKIFEFLILA